MEAKPYPKLKGPTVTLRIPKVGDTYTGTNRPVGEKDERTDKFIGMDFYIDKDGAVLPYPLPDRRTDVTTPPEGSTHVQIGWCYPEKQTPAKMEHLESEGYYLGPVHTIPKSEVHKVERDLNRKSLVDVGTLADLAEKRLAELRAQTEAQLSEARAALPAPEDDAAKPLPVGGMNYTEYMAAAKKAGMSHEAALTAWRASKDTGTASAVTRPGPPPVADDDSDDDGE